MRALLLATGEERKLPPLTTRYPSPMLPVANRPVIAYAVELMARHDFDDILVSLLHKADMVETYLEMGRQWNVQFTYLPQRMPLGSAGSLKRAQSLLNDSFLVMPGDTLADLDLTDLYAFHRSHDGSATAVLAARVAGASQTPTVQMGSDSRILSVQTEPGHGNAFVCTDVFLFEPDVLDLVPHQTVFDCKRDLLSQLLAHDAAIYGYVSESYWNPIDTFADYQAAQRDCLNSLLVAPEARVAPTCVRYVYVEEGGDGAGRWRGRGASIHPSVQINAPVIIGAGCQIGRDASIGPGVIIGPNSIVDVGATIEHSTVLANTYIGRLVKLHGKIVSASTLIDLESEASVEIADRVLLGSAGTPAADAVFRSTAERLTALLALICLLPLVLILALLVWCANSDSVLVRELRIGRRPNDPSPSDEGDLPQCHILRLRTRAADGAVTPVGRHLERWEMYRLPELWNVVRGELALVGVKPLTPDEASLATEAWQRRRFDCAVGFTGRWYTEADAGCDTDALFMADTYQAAVQSPRDAVRQLMTTPSSWRRRVTAAQRRMDRPVVRRTLSPLVDIDTVE